MKGRDRGRYRGDIARTGQGGGGGGVTSSRLCNRKNQAAAAGTAAGRVVREGARSV